MSKLVITIPEQTYTIASGKALDQALKNNGGSEQNIENFFSQNLANAKNNVKMNIEVVHDDE